MSATVGNVWSCSICNTNHSEEKTYCVLCLYARPMNRRGVPQIFAGFAIHFNGVIPHTIIHPSHSIEWRMAERYGAVCIPKFDPMSVNLLVYREGYERSEKSRLCIEHHTHIPVVPITWMMESLMQSRLISPASYRLTTIPAVANPSLIGNTIPHYNHPFYFLNKLDYAIPTSFPTANSKKSVTNSNEISKKKFLHSGISCCANRESSLLPIYEVKPPQFSNVDVYDAVVLFGDPSSHSKEMGVPEKNPIIDLRKNKTEIHLFESLQRHNSINRSLFTGMKVIFSPSLEVNETLLKAVQTCGASVMSSSTHLEETLQAGCTHVIYAHCDKKSDFMIEVVYLKSSRFHTLHLVQSNWLEDCVMLGEYVPVCGRYIPTAKLIETLQKKYMRKNLTKSVIAT